VNEALARIGLADGNDVAVQIGAVGIFKIRHVLAIRLRRGRIHHDNGVEVDDGQITGLAETHALDHGRGLLLRFFLRQGAAGGQVAEHLDGAQAQVGGIAQVGAALFDADLADFQGVIDKNNGDAQQAANQGNP